MISKVLVEIKRFMKKCVVLLLYHVTCPCTCFYKFLVFFQFRLSSSSIYET